MERTRRFRLTLRSLGGAFALAVLFLPGLAGCGGGPSFAAILARIDTSPGSASQEAWANAARLAGNTEDRLRLLKRAMARGSDVFASTAAAIIASGPVSRPVALAALDAFLDTGRYADAYGLFDGPLDSSEQASGYAELAVAASRAGYPLVHPTERLVACSDATGDTRFIVTAAVQSMAEGDRATAASLLADSARADTPARLLWYAGAIEVMAERFPDSADPLDLELYADAAFLLGNKATATATYAEIIESFPSWSWKPYAMLARAAADEREPLSSRWPHEADPDSFAAQSSPEAMTDSFMERMVERFPGTPGVVLEQARMAMLRGKPGEALSMAESLEGESGAMARLAYGPRELRVTAAMRLASDFPESAAALDAALDALANAGAWDRFSAVLSVAENRGIEPNRSWFWRALGMVISGDTVSATESIEKYGPAETGYAGAFDLGILAIAANKPERALDYLEIATGLARTATDRASALLLMGDVHMSMNKPDKAKSAWQAALGFDPDSRLARARLLRLETGR